MNLKIYINDIFYKTVTVTTDNNNGYDAKPIMMQLMTDRDAGLLSAFNVSAGMATKLVPE
jgi:hypothetical protein